MCLVVRLHRFVAMMFGVQMMRMRDVCMMRGFLMVASRMMLGGFLMMFCRVLVMFGSLLVVFLWHGQPPLLIF